MKTLLFLIVATLFTSTFSEAQTRGGGLASCANLYVRSAGTTCVTSSGHRFYLAVVYPFNGGRQEIWRDLTDGQYWSNNLGPRDYDTAKNEHCDHPAVRAAEAFLHVTFGIPSVEVLRDAYVRNFFREVARAPSSTGWWMTRNVSGDEYALVHTAIAQTFFNSNTGQALLMNVQGANRPLVYGDLRCSTHSPQGLVFQ